MAFRAIIKICNLLLIHSALGGTDDFSSIVYPKVLQSRDEGGRQILVIDDGLQLKLEKSSVLAKRFLYTTHEDGMEIHHHLDGEDLEKNLYHDSDKMASLLMSTEGGLRVEGIVGRNLRIRPLDARERSSEGDTGHLLYQVKERMPRAEDILYAPGKEFEEGGANFVKPVHVDARQDQTTHTQPETRPEVAIMVDTAHTLTFKGKGEEKHKKIIEYFSVLMNAVNLKYTTLHYITVKLILSAILRQNKTVEKMYINLYNDSDNLMNTYKTMNNLTAYVAAQKDAFSPYDLLVLVTGRDLVSVYGDGSTSRGTSGLAFVGKVCDERYKVALVEDLPPTYDGVQTFAHEVGHTMGCVHDGAKADASIPNHPGAINCSAAEKHVMTPVSAFDALDEFSYCCSQQMFVVYHLETSACLTEETTTSVKTSTQLPGDLLSSADQYCKYQHPEHNETVKNMPNLQVRDMWRCGILCRLTEKSSYMHVHRAPDGMPCENGTAKVCINNKCVDYTSPPPEQ